MASGNSLENLELILEAEKEEENDESSDEGSDGEEESSDDEETDEDDDGDEEDEAEEEEGDGNEETVEAEASDDEDDDDDDYEGGEEEDEEEEEVEDGIQEDGDKFNEMGGSDSGGEDVDKCPICLSGLRSQDIGTPESCDHTFCLECIQEWAKNVNTCPVDRQVFHIILARHAGKEKIFKQFPVADKEQENEEEEEDDLIYCEICGQSNQEDRLLLCDGCDLGYHCDCLTPPLAQVPVDAWFCPQCQARRGFFDHPVDINLPRQARRQIGRTLISERVRRLIQDARAERAERRQRIAEMIEAQEEMGENLDEPGPSSEAPANPRPVRQRKTPSTTRRKKTTKRKTTKRKTTRKKTTTKRKTKGKKKVTRKRKTTKKGKGKGKKRKKTTKKKATSSPSAARTVSLPPPSTVKGRIADRLGLSKPPVGRAIPLQKVASGAASAREGPHKASDIGQSSFSILGNKDELYSFAEMEGEERQIVNRPAISAEEFLSQSARLSHTRISITPSKKKVEVSNSIASTSSGFDLLGSILMNQDILAKGGRHITINRDGSLSAKSSSTASSSPNKSVSDKASTSVTTSSDVSSSSPSISNVSGSSENRQHKSPLPKKVENGPREVKPSPEKIALCGFKDASLPDESQQGAKAHTYTFEDNSSDDELLNFCVKSEGMDFTQREGKVTDGEVCSETNPSSSANLDFQEDITTDHKTTDQSSDLNQTSHNPSEISVQCSSTLPNPIISSEGGREEGEATDSNEEGEIVSEDEVDNAYKNRNFEEDGEEGEIIEEEEKQGTEDKRSKSKCIRALEAGDTDFAKREDMTLSAASEGYAHNSEMQTITHQNHMDMDSVVIKKEIEEAEEEEEEEEDFDPYDPKNGSFLVARFLHSLVTNEFDRKKEAAQRREERERRKEEEERRKKESEMDLSDHKISILDFIGNAGARFGVTGDYHNRPQGRGRGRGMIQPVHFGARRTSNDDDLRDSWIRGMRDSSFTPKRNGYEGASEKVLERTYFHDRKYPGTRSDLIDRRSQRSDSPERTSSRRIRGEKRKREDVEIHSMNGHFERDRGKRSHTSRDKRRRYEQRSERRLPKYDRRRASEENSESGSSSSSSGSDSEEGSSSGSSSSGNSPTKPTEVPAIPTSPDDSPCPTPPQEPPPPPPPLPPRSPSPQPPPPPPPQTSPPQNYIPHSAPSQHSYASSHSSVKIHPGYGHPDTASSSAHPVQGQPPHHSTHPSTYQHHHPGHPHLSSSGQNPPSHHPGGYPHPRGTAYPSSSYPHGYPYYPHPQSHSYPSSYYPSTTRPTSQQRPGAPAASTHPHAAPYSHYRMPHPSTSYSSTASAVPHPQRYPAHYPSSHAHQAATSHPYYSAHPSTHRHPVSQSYPYPNHPHPSMSSKTGTSAQAHTSHPSHPHYSHPTANSHSSAVVRNEHSLGAVQNVPSQRNLKRTRDSPPRLSPKIEVKSARVGYRPSPPTVRGVATSDRVASNILHDEVKKGFRQLVEDAVRSALRPAWSTKRVSKEAYKDIFKKCVEKVCGSKETVVQQDKIQSLVDAYVFKARKSKI